MELSEKRCPFCAETIEVEAIRCKHCQADIEQQILLPADYLDRPKSLGALSMFLIAAAVLAVIFLGFGAYVGSTPKGKAKTEARATIDLCRDHESSFSGSAGARSIITGACKILEDDFRQKFGHAP